MEQPSFQKRLADHMRKLSQLYRDVSDEKISRDEADRRLEVLKAEQQELKQAGMFPPNMQVAGLVQSPQEDDLMRRFTKRARRTYHTEHQLDFKCQCKSCVRKHTITMEDRDWLKELKIVWSKPVPEGVQES